MDSLALWTSIVYRFRESCVSYDHVWRKRRRVFDTFSMVLSLLDLAGSSFNTYARSIQRIFKYKDIVPVTSAFCMARMKMPGFIISEIRNDIYEHWLGLELPVPQWFGLNIHAVDGSKITMREGLEKDGYINHGGRFPLGLMSLMINVDTRLITDLHLSTHYDERLDAQIMLEKLSPKDLVLYDRGYFSFALLTEHVSLGITGVFRVGRSSFREINGFWASKKTDEIVELWPSKEAEKGTRKRCPDRTLRPLKIRLLKYRIGKKQYVLASTLIDERIPLEAYKALYARRWTIEEVFKIFKRTLNVEHMKARSALGAEQEIHAASLLWNFARMIDLLNQIDNPIKKSTWNYQTNYRASVLITGEKVAILFLGGSSIVSQTLDDCLKYIHRTKQAIRPNRSFERITRRRFDRWTKTKPRKKKAA